MGGLSRLLRISLGMNLARPLDERRGRRRVCTDPRVSGLPLVDGWSVLGRRYSESERDSELGGGYTLDFLVNQIWSVVCEL